MGGLTHNQQLILYSLGQCSKRLNERFEDKPLEVSVSKVAFIEALDHSGLVVKKARALYKNLETLEKKKLISYKQKQLRFTRRGFRMFTALRQQVVPFVLHKQFWETELPINRRLQAVFKGEQHSVRKVKKRKTRVRGKQLTIPKL
jgi:hypothetical protein